MYGLDYNKVIILKKKGFNRLKEVKILNVTCYIFWFFVLDIVLF